MVELPFEACLLSDTDRDFLLGQRQGGSRFHKNVSYRPPQDRLRGLADPTQRERMRSIMRSYSQQVLGILGRLSPRYATCWNVDYASFRPIEEDGRQLPLLRRNDLMHVDAFPTRPTRGGRILRFFTNISRDQPRIWRTGPRFDRLATTYAMAAGLDRVHGPWSRLRDGILRPVSRMIPMWPALRRSAYDRFMLAFHDFLKRDADFQQCTDQRPWSFAPGTCWAVFTDAVPHAVHSGCFALEQTVIVPVEAMRSPDLAPIRVLERLCGRSLA